jgi:hypothetical protein
MMGQTQNRWHITKSGKMVVIHFGETTKERKSRKQSGKQKKE